MSDKSTELNGADAIEYLGMIEDVSGVKEFIEGDTRKGVLAAAEKRIAALTPDNPAVRSQEVSAEETPAVSEQPEQEEDSEEEKPKTATMQADGWMYCKDHEPRIFKAGEPVSEGWTASPKDIVGKVWSQDISGKWERVK